MVVYKEKLIGDSNNNKVDLSEKSHFLHLTRHESVQVNVAFSLASLPLMDF